MICMRCHDTMTVESFPYFFFFFVRKYGFANTQQTALKHEHSFQLIQIRLKRNRKWYGKWSKYMRIFSMQLKKQSEFWNIHAIWWLDPSPSAPMHLLHFLFHIHNNIASSVSFFDMKSYVVFSSAVLCSFYLFIYFLFVFLLKYIGSILVSSSQCI